MIDFILSILAGWPAILASVILAVVGLLKSNYRLLVMSAIIAFPFSLYLSGFPVFLTPVLVFGAAWAMYYHKEMIAWIPGHPLFSCGDPLTLRPGGGSSLI